MREFAAFGNDYCIMCSTAAADNESELVSLTRRPPCSPDETTEARTHDGNWAPSRHARPPIANLEEAIFAPIFQLVRKPSLTEGRKGRRKEGRRQIGPERVDRASAQNHVETPRSELNLVLQH